MIDDEAGPVKENDEDTYVDEYQNNIWTYLDPLDPSTNNILGGNITHSISINDLPDVRCRQLQITKKTQITENDSLERPHNAKINLLKNISPPAQTIRV